MGIGDAYLGLVDLLSHNGKHASSFVQILYAVQLLIRQKTAPNLIVRSNA
jgi:hypothetical protein